jgi:DNA-binding MltR family transcriptional regulator
VASILDTALEDLLKAYFVNDPNVASNMLGQMRPLGTFSARIDMAYLLGWISLDIHRDLHLIRKIRNDFGHRMKALSFEDPMIRPRCLEIQIMAEVPGPVRTKFRLAAVWILGVIFGATSLMEHKASPQIEIPKNLDSTD